MASTSDYPTSTRHPWPCLLFLLPLLLAYEGGVIYLSGMGSNHLRNGADSWIRDGFSDHRLASRLYCPRALLTLSLIVWCYFRWSSRPRDLLSVLTGMTIESIGFALGLWILSRCLGPFSGLARVRTSPVFGTTGRRGVVVDLPRCRDLRRNPLQTHHVFCSVLVLQKNRRANRVRHWDCRARLRYAFLRRSPFRTPRREISGVRVFVPFHRWYLLLR